MFCIVILSEESIFCHIAHRYIDPSFLMIPPYYITKAFSLVSYCIYWGGFFAHLNNSVTHQKEDVSFTPLSHIFSTNQKTTLK